MDHRSITPAGASARLGGLGHWPGRVGSAVLATLLALVAMGMPGSAPAAMAAACDSKQHRAPILSAGTVTPGSGVPATSFTFSVLYRDLDGCAPRLMTVTIVGIGTFDMTPTGSSWASGVTFRHTRTLPLGSWSYRYATRSGTGAGQKRTELTTVSPTSVAVTTTPPPTPVPTPVPTPRPTARPTAAPTAPPSAAPTARPTSRPAPTASPPPTTAPGPTASPAAPATSKPSGGPGGSSGPAASAGTGGDPSLPVATDPVTGAVIGGSGSGGEGGPGSTDGGRPGGAVTAPGTRGGPGQLLLILPLVILGVAALGFLFVVVARRRRREEQVATAEASAASASLAPAARPLPPDVVPGEEDMPRWRRPSLLAARQARSGPTDAVLRHFPEPPAPGVERRVVRYDVVRLTDTPDEVRGLLVGTLDQGDEVELIEERGTQWLVRTPEGVEGWLHRMTVGVPDPAAD